MTSPPAPPQGLPRCPLCKSAAIDSYERTHAWCSNEGNCALADPCFTRDQWLTLCGPTASAERERLAEALALAHRMLTNYEYDVSTGVVADNGRDEGVELHNRAMDKINAALSAFTAHASGSGRASSVSRGDDARSERAGDG